MGAVVTAWEGLEVEHDAVSAAVDLRHDVVLRPSATTRTLAALMIRSPVRRALDIGTGCGALALVAARFSEEVVATDVNARALSFTARNADRNGVTNIRCTEGPLVEPVADERFGLVVGNLPFVISPPASGLTFRDGDRESDPGDSAICRRAVVEGARVLEPGGTAQFLVNWIVADVGRHFDEPVRWVTPTGCTGVILLHSLMTPAEYVARWAVTSADDPAAWRDHLDSIGAAAIANGAITIRRTEGKNPPIRTARMTTSPRGHGGEQLERILMAQRPTDAALLDARPVLVTPHTWAAPPGRPDDPDRRRLVASDTCGVTASVERPIDSVVQRLDGRTGLDEAVNAWSRHQGITDRRTVHRLGDATLGVMRRLTSLGLADLHPTGHTGAPGAAHRP